MATFLDMGRSCAGVLLSLGLLAGCGDDHADDSGTGGSTSGTGAQSGTGTGAGNGTGSTGAGPACDGAPTVDTTALVLDGVDDYVTMGVAPELGLEQFTVEAWVRRDGKGVTAGTGVGGLQLVPIAGKGRGESDGSNLDCNYAFGFVGDVLGADFEDTATGLNHPIVGSGAVTMGVWHHVAASYDGSTWRLYLDGNLDAEKAADATPRADSIQHFGIGAALDSTGTPAGALEGAIDEVRVWDHARTPEEIAAAMNTTVTSSPGLVGRWALDTASPSADSVGTNDGTIEGGATISGPGAPLDLGAAPTVSVSGPGDTVTGNQADLAVDVADPEGHASTVTFHVREITAADDFTIVVLPDTQYYTRVGDNHNFFYDQTKWVMDNRAEYNIVAVIHNGDIVDNGNIDSQWTVADTAMSKLEETSNELPEGMVYGVCVGNHDESPNSDPTGTTKFNVHFGVDRFAGRSYYGGHYQSTNDENWFTFTAGGLDFVVVDLKYNTNPDPAVQAWMRGIFEAHPDAFGIVNSHYIVGATGKFGPQGAAIYDAVKDVPNVHLMTNGHVAAEARRDDDFQGHVIHSMLADYQGRPDGGGGLMRIWEFSPANNELTVRSYSPTKDVFETDEDSEFTLPVKLDGIGGAFHDLQTIDPAVGSAKATYTGLESGRKYEWYATVSDCVHSVATPVQSFTVE